MHFQANEVVEVLDRLFGERGKADSLRCDNGPEFTGRRCQSKLARAGEGRSVAAGDA